MIGSISIDIGLEKLQIPGSSSEIPSGKDLAQVEGISSSSLGLNQRTLRSSRTIRGSGPKPT